MYFQGNNRADFDLFFPRDLDSISGDSGISLSSFGDSLRSVEASQQESSSLLSHGTYVYGMQALGLSDREIEIANPVDIFRCPRSAVPEQLFAQACRQDKDGDTALHLWIAQGASPQAVENILLMLSKPEYKKTVLNIQNKLGQTPLHVAAVVADSDNSYEMCKVCIKHGASPDARDRFLRTPVNAACHSVCTYKNAFNLLRVLEESGYNTSDIINMKDDEGRDCLQALIITAIKNGVPSAPWQRSSPRKTPPEIYPLIELLIAYGADIETKHTGSGMTLLQIVADWEDKALYQWLQSAYSDILPDPGEPAFSGNCVYYSEKKGAFVWYHESEREEVLNAAS